MPIGKALLANQALDVNGPHLYRAKIITNTDVFKFIFVGVKSVRVYAGLVGESVIIIWF